MFVVFYFHLPHTPLFSLTIKTIVSSLHTNAHTHKHTHTHTHLVVDGALTALGLFPVTPGRNYTAIIFEATDAGFGPPSLPYKFSTPPDFDVLATAPFVAVVSVPVSSIPVANTDGTAAAAPNNDKPDAATVVRWNISWPRPVEPKGRLVRFEVGYADAGRDNGTVVFACRNCTNILLDPKRFPVAAGVRVRVVNAAGTGAWSEPTTPLSTSSSPAITESSSSLSTGSIVLIVVLPIAVILLVAALLWWRWKQRIVYQEFAFPPVDQWNIPPEAIEIRRSHVLGSGQAGAVYEARLLKDTARFAAGTLVAAKMLHDVTDFSRKVDFVREAELMKKASALQHPNVLQLVGVAMRAEPLIMVMELAPNGDLQHYLRHNSMRLTEIDQLVFARDVARGMAWLTSQSIVHCDLSARNCLVGVGGVVKVRLQRKLHQI